MSKSDVGTAECAVWKVDNQNLLQKYAPEPDEQNPSRIVYRNSSTVGAVDVWNTRIHGLSLQYAGWCEQNTCRYMVVNVRVQKQTRTECVVVPDYALTDLLPAVSLTESEQLALALTSAIFQVRVPPFMHWCMSLLCRRPARKCPHRCRQPPMQTI